MLMTSQIYAILAKALADSITKYKITQKFRVSKPISTR
jgi:hypothetical protein